MTEDTSKQLEPHLFIERGQSIELVDFANFQTRGSLVVFSLFATDVVHTKTEAGEGPTPMQFCKARFALTKEVFMAIATAFKEHGEKLGWIDKEI